MPDNVSHGEVDIRASSCDPDSALAAPPSSMTNSSSFSRKISAAAAAGLTAPICSSGQLDAVSDNEGMGDYSPLRRRMSLADYSAKHDSPPKRSCDKPSLERNPSPLADRRHMVPSPSHHRDRLQIYGGLFI